MARDEEMEREAIRSRLRAETLRLVLAGLAIPLPLIAALNLGRFHSLAVQLKLPSSLFPQATSYLAVIVGVGASTLGWICILPLLKGRAGWRSQVACLIAVGLAVQSALVIAGLVAAVSSL